MFRKPAHLPHALLAAAIALVSGCSFAPGPQQAATGEQRKEAAGFSLAGADGAEVSLGNYKGKVVLLNFWATWCGPCKVEIPWFIGFQKQYQSRGFSVIGVSMDDDGWKSVKPYIAEKQINYPVVLGNDDMTHAYGDIDSLPTSFLIDRSGRVTAVHSGLVSRNDYATEIERLLGGEQRDLP